MGRHRHRSQSRALLRNEDDAHVRQPGHRQLRDVLERRLVVQRRAQLPARLGEEPLRLLHPLALGDVRGDAADGIGHSRGIHEREFLGDVRVHAVFVGDELLLDPGRAELEHRLGHLLEAGRAVGREDVVDRLAHDLLARAVEQPLPLPVHEDVAALGVEQDEDGGGVVQDGAQLPLALLEGLLGALALRHVEQHGERADPPALGVALGDGRQQHVQALAVLLHELVRHVLAGALLEEGGEDRLPGMPRGLLRQELHRVAAQHLLARVAQCGQPAVADTHQPPVTVDGVHHHRRAVVERPVLLLALEQGLLGLLELGDVVEDGDPAPESAARVPHRPAAHQQPDPLGPGGVAKEDLHLAQRLAADGARQGQVLGGIGRALVREEEPVVLGPLGEVRVRDAHAQQPLRGGVDEDEPAMLVHHRHALRHAGDDGLEEALRPLAGHTLPDVEGQARAVDRRGHGEETVRRRVARPPRATPGTRMSALCSIANPHPGPRPGPTRPASHEGRSDRQDALAARVPILPRQFASQGDLSRRGV